MNATGGVSARTVVPPDAQTLPEPEPELEDEDEDEDDEDDEDDEVPEEVPRVPELVVGEPLDEPDGDPVSAADELLPLELLPLGAPPSELALRPPRDTCPPHPAITDAMTRTEI
jgi:hypothetical protein